MTYEPEDLDRLLDEALASYSSEEPRPGIEGRILQRVRTTGLQERFGWWRWAIAIPVLAYGLIFAVTYMPRSRILPLVPNMQLTRAATQHSGQSVTQPVKLAGHVRRSFNKRVVARRSLPKEELFPLPAAFSAEERALLDLAARFPTQASEAAVPVEPRAIEPIEIPKIEIAPLSGGSEQ